MDNLALESGENTDRLEISELDQQRYFAGLDLQTFSSTPFCVVNTEILRHQYESFRNAFSRVARQVEVAFSWKTAETCVGNYFYRNFEKSLHLTSVSQLEQINQYEIFDAKLYYTEPGFSYQELERLAERDVMIALDSLSQLEMLESYCQNQGRAQEFAIRIDPGVVPIDVYGQPTRYTPSKSFKGHTFAEAREVIRRSNNSKYLKLVGIHCHLATQNVDLSAWSKSAELLVNFIVENELNVEFLNLGGGYPIPYGENRRSFVPSINEVAAAVAPSVAKLSSFAPSSRLILEPGRYISGPAGVLVATVMARKTRGSKEILVLDDSRYSASRDIVHPHVLEAHATFSTSNTNKCYTLVGKTASSNEVLTSGSLLPEMKIGDRVRFNNAGAYTTVDASNFAGAQIVQSYLSEQGKVLN